MADEENVPSLDPNLWITASGHDGRLYLLGNAHTFPGRMVAWIADAQAATFVSRAEITAASDAARYWIDGFLRGNEPTLAEYLGLDDFAADALDDEDPRVARWRVAIAEFDRTGAMPSLRRIPTKSLPPGVRPRLTLWTWAGGEVWTWTGSAWTVPDAQPELDGEFLRGSACSAVGHHEMDGSGDHLLWCVRCGFTEETIDATSAE